MRLSMPLNTIDFSNSFNLFNLFNLFNDFTPL